MLPIVVFSKSNMV